MHWKGGTKAICRKRSLITEASGPGIYSTLLYKITLPECNGSTNHITTKMDKTSGTIVQLNGRLVIHKACVTMDFKQNIVLQQTELV